MHKFERVIRIIVVLIILLFVSLLVARVTQAQMSPYDDELSQQLRGVRRPAFSPDGRFVTYARTTIDRATHAETTELVTVSVSDRQEITVARAAINVALPAPSGSVFSSDSAVKFELADDREGAQLRSVSARDGVTSTLFRCACSLSQLAVDRAGTVAAFVRSSNTEPPDVWTIALTRGATAKPLTRVNARVVLEALMTEAETLPSPASSEVSPSIRVIPPASLEPGRRYPIIVRVVDTARAQTVYAFDDRAQLWSTRGYGVLLVGVRDSANAADAVPELMTAVDAAITHYAWIDSARLGLSADTSRIALMAAIRARSTQFNFDPPSH